MYSQQQQQRNLKLLFKQMAAQETIRLNIRNQAKNIPYQKEIPSLHQKTKNLQDGWLVIQQQLQNPVQK